MGNKIGYHMGKKSTLYPNRPRHDADALRFYNALLRFAKDTNMTAMKFPLGLDGLQRKKIHTLAEQFQFQHTSVGKGRAKTIIIEKVPSEVLLEQKNHEAFLRRLLKSFQRQVQKSLQDQQRPTGSVPVELDRSKLPLHVRYCNWNIEWMDRFFKDDTA